MDTSRTKSKQKRAEPGFGFLTAGVCFGFLAGTIFALAYPTEHGYGDNFLMLGFMAICGASILLGIVSEAVATLSRRRRMMNSRADIRPDDNPISRE